MQGELYMQEELDFQQYHSRSRGSLGHQRSLICAQENCVPLSTKDTYPGRCQTVQRPGCEPYSRGRMNDCVADWFIIHICRCMDRSASLCNTARWFDLFSRHLA
jgi:hypothetical protein